MSAVRTCVGCGGRDAQDAFLRLQVSGDGRLVVVERPIAGRSAYVHGRPECFDGFVRSKLLRRSLRRDVDRDTRKDMRAVLEETAMRAAARLPQSAA